MDAEWKYAGVHRKFSGSQPSGIGRPNASAIQFSAHWIVVGRNNPRSRLSAQQRNCPRRFESCTWDPFCHSPRLIRHVFQPNILIDAKGCPRLSDFACSSITRNINSANASTPNRGPTLRYCAPELLGDGAASNIKKQKPTKKTDVYSLSMVIVEVCLFSGSMMHLGLDCFRF